MMRLPLRLLIILLWCFLPLVFFGSIIFFLPIMVIGYLPTGHWYTPPKVFGCYVEWVLDMEEWARRSPYRDWEDQ